MYELRHFENNEGRDLFGEWLDCLEDKQTRARIAMRLIRLENGNFGDCKPVGGGVWELRIDWGPGYRIYYAIENKKVLLLCCGGDKRTQKNDIKTAIKRWQVWRTKETK